MAHVTIHDVSQRQFLDVKKRVLTIHGGTETAPGGGVECQGVRCEVEYDTNGKSLDVVIQTTPQLITSGYLIGWLCDALAQAPA